MPPKRTFKLQKKPSALKRGHPTLQNMNFKIFFSTFVGNFCPPGSGSTDPIESGSNPDPDTDPQPCWSVYNMAYMNIGQCARWCSLTVSSLTRVNVVS